MATSDHVASLPMRVLLWVAVLPVSVVAYILAHTIFFLPPRWNLSRVLDDPLPWVYVLAGGAGAILFVAGGAAVAPSKRGLVALALLILNIAIQSSVLALHLAGVLFSRPVLEVGLEFLGNLGGSATALYIVFNAYGWHGAGPVSWLWRGAN